MWEVYNNAYCIIAATASSDGAGGLFRTRNPLATLPCKVEAACDGLPVGKYYCVDDYQLSREVRDSPLNLRGWVLQEWALSRRILHFG
jgi:hypothetical protein